MESVREMTFWSLKTLVENLYLPQLEHPPPDGLDVGFGVDVVGLDVGFQITPISV